MTARERVVLHVLPHAGGGGDTYVDMLSAMGGYRFARLYITPKRKPGLGEVASRVFDLRRAVRGYDLLHVHGEGAGAMFLPLLAARRSIVTLHGVHLVRRETGVRRSAAAVNLRAIIRAASRTICVSHAEREEVAGFVSHGAMARTVVVHNGAQLMARAGAAERSAVRRELGIDDSTPVGIWVGSLDERRDPLSVVRAAARTSTSVVFVGDGPLRADVERAAGAEVRVLGQRQDVPRLLGAADFFVLMSEREGFSFAILEAMAHGLPALVAAVPENVEAIGDSGIAVPYGDERAIAAAFQQLGGDPEVRAELGARARGRVLELFSAEEMIARTRAIYDEVLASV
jgi:glycosyltransferase involved in cell wall biosynthesis